MLFEDNIRLNGHNQEELQSDLDFIFSNGGKLGKILEATELELLNYYNCCNYSGLITYCNFRDMWLKTGTKIIGGE